MDTKFPKRTLCIRDSSLGKGVFRGRWAVVLEQMINYLGVKTKVIVKCISYYDGSTLAKYRVALKLPSELNVGLNMPYGEAKHVEIAFHIAVVKAITKIRTAKGKVFEGTLFHGVPSDNYYQELDVDYLTFAKNNPRDMAV